MTTREKFEKMLTNNGMFESQAKKVMDLAIPVVDGFDNYKMTWERPANEYPDPLYAVIYMMIEPIALKWIEDNCPKAWFKPMFEPK